jgi:hypothetical protein
VNDLDVMSSAQKASQCPGQAMRDYHSIMATILSSFIRVQDEGRFPFEFPFGDLGVLNLKFPVSYVIGDIKGLSVLCGFYGNYSANRIHHACSCSFVDSDDPYMKCTRVAWHEVQALVKCNDKSRLKAMSQHLVDNAFYKVEFCDDVYGIHGCTPVGMLHTLQLGLFQYYMDGLIGDFQKKEEAHCWVG